MMQWLCAWWRGAGEGRVNGLLMPVEGEKNIKEKQIMSNSILNGESTLA